jgi:hypothetical protein
MPAMPIPMIPAAIASAVRVSVGRVTVCSAKPEMMTAMSNDAAVIGRSKAIGIGRCSASIPMKCIDQMPVPMAQAPPISQYLAVRGDAAVRRLARSRATYDASTAMTYERAMSAGLYTPVMNYAPCRQSAERLPLNFPRRGTTRAEYRNAAKTRCQGGCACLTTSAWHR